MNHGEPESQPSRTCASASKRMKTKRGSACERCHRRRSKCDAWAIGLPCTACRASNNHDQCHFIFSKRTRGHNGRYTAPPRSIASPEASVREKLVEIGRKNESPSPRSISEPNINNDLVRLYGNGCGNLVIEQMLSEQCATSISREPLPVDSRTHYVGESWYATYVLNHSTSPASHTSLDPAIDLHSASSTGPSATGMVSDWKHVDETCSDLPPSHLVEKLLEEYFSKFHTFCPIVDRIELSRSLKDGTVSPTLLRCVLYVASIHCESDTIYQLGFSSRVDAGDSLFSKACAAFNADQKSDRLTLLLSSYLLHYWFGKPTAHRDFHWWLAMAIRYAQCMGYHRRPKPGSCDDEAHWKRLWWCLYIRDRQVALSTGMPMAINDHDCDVEPLTTKDFPDDSPETARYVILQAELNRIASQMFFCHCSPSRLHLAKNHLACQKASEDIQANLTAWHGKAQQWNLWNQIHPLSLNLKICYFHYSMNLQQRLQRVTLVPHKDLHLSAIIHNAADEISQLVDDALLHFSVERFPMILVSALLSAIAVYITDAKQLRISPRQLSLTIRPYLLALKQLEEVYVLARWIRNLFMRLVGTYGRECVAVASNSPEDSLRQEQHKSTRPTSFCDIECFASDSQGQPAGDNSRQTVTIGMSSFAHEAHEPKLHSGGCVDPGLPCELNNRASIMECEKTWPEPEFDLDLNNSGNQGHFLDSSFEDETQFGVLGYHTLHSLAELGLSGCYRG